MHTDIFSSSSNEKAVEVVKSHPNVSQQSEETDALNHETGGPLPPGWERKVDHKTGRSYYEK